MSKFLEVTCKYDWGNYECGKYLINSDNIHHISKRSDGVTTIYFFNSDILHVTETYEEIKAMLDVI